MRLEIRVELIRGVSKSLFRPPVLEIHDFFSVAGNPQPFHQALL